MSITKKIAHNTLIQIIGKIISTFLGLVALGIMTRYFGTDDRFGWYITTITFLQFIGILIDFGLIPVTASLLSEGKIDKERLLQNLLGFRLVTAAVTFGLAPLIALFFPYPIEVKIAIALSSFSFFGVAMNQIFTGYYQTKLKMIIPVIAELIGRIILVIGIYILTILEAGFLPIMTMIMVAGVLTTAILWLQSAKETQTKPMFDQLVWKTIIIKMWPIAIAIMFNVIYLKGDTLLLTIFRGAGKEVGDYGAAYRVLDLVTQTAMIMMGVMLPLLTSAWTARKKEEFRLHYQQSFNMMMLLALPATIGTALLAEPIMKIVASEKFDYIAAGSALRVLSLAMFGVYLGAIFGHLAVAINRQKQTMWIYISDAILTLTGYLIFIPKFGMMGAAWMTVFSEVYAGVLLLLVVRRYAQVSLEIKTFAKILFAAAVMGAVLLQLQHIHVLILVIIGALVYGFFLLGLGAVSKQTLIEIVEVKQG